MERLRFVLKLARIGEHVFPELLARFDRGKSHWAGRYDCEESFALVDGAQF